MKNPWMKKNPFLSVWLSSTHALAGSAGGRALAEARRQTASVMARSAKRMFGFWTEVLTSPPPPKRRRR